MTHSVHREAIRKKDLCPLSYAEFGELLQILTDNVLAACREHRVRVDIVAPILRSGAVPGCHLASKLGVVALLPLQYKHTSDPVHPIRDVFTAPRLIDETREAVTVLIVDTNTVTGSIARRAAADVRARYPGSKILFASVMMDVSLDLRPAVDILVAAKHTNENRTLSHSDAASVGVSAEVYVFPWEHLDEQWAEIQAAEASERAKLDGL